MKKLTFNIIIASSIILYACNASKNSENGSQSNSIISMKEPNIKKVDLESKSTQSIGEGIMSKSDCYSCHTNDTKLVGPAFIDISKKYANEKGSVDTLVSKIINGGKGVWGEVPMQAHKLLSSADAIKMVDYILTLK